MNRRQPLRLTDVTRSRLGGLSNVAQTIALPHEHAPIRTPTYPNLERTATVSLEFNGTTNSSAYGVPYRRYMVMRDPACPYWVDTLTTVATHGYCFGVYPAATFQDEVFLEACARLSPVGQTDEVDQWLWVPGDYSSFDPSAAPLASCTWAVNGGADNTVTYEVYPSDGKIFQQQVIVPGGGVFPCIHADVWIRVTNISTGAGFPSRLMLYATAGKHVLLPAFSPLESTTSVAPYSNSRATAAALLLTNVSKVQVKQGTIQAARLQNRTDKFWSWSKPTLSVVHPSERYYGAAEVGAYTYTAPTQSSERFRDSVKSYSLYTTFNPPAISTDVVYVPAPFIDCDDPFNALLIEEDAVAVDETLFAVTCDLHIEFRTSSSLFAIGVSGMPLEQYHACQLALAQTGYFFENSTHWANLASLVMRGLRVALPVVAPGLVGPANAISTLYNAGKSIMMRTKRNTNTMKQKQMVMPRSPRRKVTTNTRKGKGKRNGAKRK